jgi:branched-chain amino acid transport system permease protein
MGGVFSIWGAIAAAFFLRFLPALLNDWGVSTELLTILFGVGLIQVLLTAPGGVVDQFPKDMRRLYGAISRLFKRPSPGTAA